MALFLFMLTLFSAPAEAQLEPVYVKGGQAAAECAAKTPGAQECFDLALALYRNYQASRPDRDVVIPAPVRGDPIEYTGPTEAAFHGAPTEKVLLLVHSYTHAPGEMRELGRMFAAQGYTVFPILLEGHGPRSTLAGGTHSLKYTSRQEWKRDVEFGLNLAHAFGKKVFMAGYSLGGLLSILEGAKENPRIDGLLAIAPPVGLHDRLWGGPGACATLPMMRAFGFDLLVGNMIGYSPAQKAYVAEFVAGTCELLSLMEEFVSLGRAGNTVARGLEYDWLFPHQKKFFAKVRSDLSTLKVPYVIISSPNDDIVSHGMLVQLVKYSTGRGELLESSSPDHLHYAIGRHGPDYTVYERAFSVLDAIN